MGRPFTGANPKICASKTGLGFNPEALKEVIGCLFLSCGVVLRRLVIR